MTPSSAALAASMPAFKSSSRVSFFVLLCTYAESTESDRDADAESDERVPLSLHRVHGVVADARCAKAI